MSVKKLDFNTYIHDVQRSQMKRLKLEGSRGVQSQKLLSKSVQIGEHSASTVHPNDHSLTLIDAVQKKINII